MVAGGYAYGYLFISQNSFAQEMFSSLLDSVKPSRILEIGTFHGGLTLMLRDIMDNIGLSNNIITTYDINNQEFLKPLVKDRLVNVLTENLFNENYTGFINEDSKKNLASFIQQPGTTMVLCDGGCKKCEFNLISPLLKSGDIIMAHDYAPNHEYFIDHMKDRIWDWLEIQDSDIEQCVIENNLSSYFQETAQKAAWCCKMKS